MGTAAGILKLVGTKESGSKLVQAKQKPETKNMTLRLEGSLYAKIKSLVSRTGARSLQDTIRQGLIIYETLVSEAENGKDIRIVDPDNSEASYSLFTRE